MLQSITEQNIKTKPTETKIVETYQNWTEPFKTSNKNINFLFQIQKKCDLYWNTVACLVIVYNEMVESEEGINPNKFKEQYHKVVDFCEMEHPYKQGVEIKYDEVINEIISKANRKKMVKRKYDALRLSDEDIDLFLDFMYSKEKEKYMDIRPKMKRGLGAFQTALIKEYKDIFGGIAKAFYWGETHKMGVASKKKYIKRKKKFSSPTINLRRSGSNISLLVPYFSGKVELGSPKKGDSKWSDCLLLPKSMHPGNEDMHIKLLRHRTEGIGDVKMFTINWCGIKKRGTITTGHKTHKIVPVANLGEIGIDVGVTDAISVSDGRTFNMPNEKLRELKRKKKNVQKKISAKLRNNESIYKELKKQHRLEKKIINIRKDFNHKISNEMKLHKLVVFEDIDIVKMCGEKKISSKMKEAILDKNWGAIKALTKEKGQMTGAVIEEVKPQYTSQMCYHCGHIDEKNRKYFDRKKFVCLSCGEEADADTNAAKNILKVFKKFGHGGIKKGRKKKKK